MFYLVLTNIGHFVCFFFSCVVNEAMIRKVSALARAFVCSFFCRSHMDLVHILALRCCQQLLARHLVAMSVLDVHPPSSLVISANHEIILK